MNRREAKRHVCARAAQILAVNPGDWLWFEDEDVDTTNAERVERALFELIDELERRGRGVPEDSERRRE